MYAEQDQFYCETPVCCVDPHLCQLESVEFRLALTALNLICPELLCLSDYGCPVLVEIRPLLVCSLMIRFQIIIGPTVTSVFQGPKCVILVCVDERLLFVSLLELPTSLFPHIV